MGRFIISVTEGRPGTGKSLRRGPHFLLNDFLSRDGESLFITNLPIYPEKICAEAARRWVKRKARRGDDRDAMYHEIYERFLWRFVLIPVEVREAWREGTSTPSEFFNAYELNGAHVTIDECDAYVGTGASKEVKTLWRAWLSEARHAGIQQVEFITQNVRQVYSGMDGLVSLRRTFVPHHTRRDPIFKIQVGDWYEFWALFTREYAQGISELEQIAQGNKWVIENSTFFRIEKFYYPFYNSYSASEKTEGKGGSAEKHIFEEYSVVGGIAWFLRRNVFQFASRAVVACAFVWVFFMGGLVWFMEMMMSGMMQMTGAERARDMADAVVSKPGQVEASSTMEDRQAVVEDTRTMDDVNPDLLRLMGITTEEEFQASKQWIGLPEEVVELERARARVAELEAQTGMGDGNAIREGRNPFEPENVAPAPKLEAKKTALTLINPDYVIFSDGGRYEQFQRIEGGEYDGLHVMSIEFQTRRVVLSDGRILRLGVR